jgi:hypothetical protein
MMSAIDDYAIDGGKPLSVAFVIYGDQQAVDDFAEVLKTGSYKAANPAQNGTRVFDQERFARGMVFHTVTEEKYRR